MDERLPLPPPPPQSPPFSASAPASPYSALHPLLLPSPNPHLLLKPKTLTLSLSSSSLASMPPSSPPAPAPDAWELVHPAATVSAAATPVDGGLDDCAIFPPRLHEGLGLEGEAEEEAAKEAEEDDEDGEWIWGWGRCREAARRAWAAGVRAVREGVLVHRACGCPAVRPAVWSAAAAGVVVGALLYARRRDRRERDLLVLLSQEKDKAPEESRRGNRPVTVTGCRPGFLLGLVFGTLPPMDLSRREVHRAWKRTCPAAAGDDYSTVKKIKKRASRSWNRVNLMRDSLADRILELNKLVSPLGKKN